MSTDDILSRSLAYIECFFADVDWGVHELLRTPTSDPDIENVTHVTILLSGNFENVTETWVWVSLKTRYCEYREVLQSSLRVDRSWNSYIMWLLVTLNDLFRLRLRTSLIFWNLNFDEATLQKHVTVILSVSCSELAGERVLYFRIWWCHSLPLQKHTVPTDGRCS